MIDNKELAAIELEADFKFTATLPGNMPAAAFMQALRDRDAEKPLRARQAAPVALEAIRKMILRDEIDPWDQKLIDAYFDKFIKNPATIPTDSGK